MQRHHFLYLLAISHTASLTETLTPEAAVHRALQRNPALLAARESIQEARGRHLQSGRLANPELETAVFPNVAGREGSFSLALSQKFPLTQRLRLEKAATRAALNAAEAEVRAAERALATEVRAVAVKLQSLQDSMALKNKLIANSKQLAETAKSLANKGEAHPLHAMQADLEAQQLSLSLLELQTEQAPLLGEARTLLGLPAEAPLSISGSLAEPATPEAKEPDATARPDYQAAVARIDAAQQALELAKANKWEDATFSLGYQREHEEAAGAGLEKDNFLGAQFSIPLPFWNKNEGKIQEASAAVARSQKEAAALKAAIATQAATALAEMKAALRIVEKTTNDLLPAAKAIETAIAASAKNGEELGSRTEALRAREKRYGLEQTRLDGLRSFHLARIRYMAALGK
jgi:outer membrane protein, heavy metal efflux system